MDQRLPFPVSIRLWNDLPEADRDFLCFSDDDLPLPAHHAARLGMLDAEDAARLRSWCSLSIPPDWPDRGVPYFEREDVLNIRDFWNDAARRAEVRRWLFDRGIPFRRIVYLLYASGKVVQTTWKLVVRYWDAFAWSVGFAMVAVDHTLRWACCFHHEDAIIFGGPVKRLARDEGDDDHFG